MRLECTCDPNSPFAFLDCAIHGVEGPDGPLAVCPECRVPIPYRKYVGHLHDHAILKEAKR